MIDEFGSWLERPTITLLEWKNQALSVGYGNKLAENRIRHPCRLFEQSVVGLQGCLRFAANSSWIAKQLARQQPF
ncbi:MAG: hypothetical protein ACRBM6_37110, partial [Geminicoccales bacterium]